MKILVLGGTGMLGHKMFQRLSERFDHVRTAIHGPIAKWQGVELFESSRVLDNFDASDASAWKQVLRLEEPNVVVNCVGVIKQRAEAGSALSSLTLNSLFPHQVAAEMAQWGGRLIHFSTDCVFSGKRGDYAESDASDAEDLYGKTKFLGEVATQNALTLRTSMIGRELQHFKSLLEWFLRQKSARVEGYTRAMYSGLTTNKLAEVVGDIIEKHPNLSGLYQVTGQTISKYELLLLLQKAFRSEVEVVPDETFFCDRSMNGDRFGEATGFEAPSWPELIDELAADPSPYDKWARNRI
jgi:dTDP-4-dehydrorhamnose reductase